MFRSYIAMGMMSLGIFSYAQYTGISAFSEQATRPVPGQASSATHK
jgi:hypothetical protein